MEQSNTNVEVSKVKSALDAYFEERNREIEERRSDLLNRFMNKTTSFGLKKKYTRKKAEELTEFSIRELKDTFYDQFRFTKAKNLYKLCEISSDGFVRLTEYDVEDFGKYFDIGI